MNLVSKLMTTAQLQKHLKDLGLYTLAVDGDYGKGTIAAVKKLQKLLSDRNLYNFASDGVFGGLTHNGLLLYIDILAKEKLASKVPVIPGEIDFTRIIYGKELSDEFIRAVWWMAEQLRHPSVTVEKLTNDFIACMAWESGGTFSPSIKNGAGSGATGLIQFMPSTAKGLGTTTTKLAKMSQIEQLNYVYKYFLPYKGKLANLGDVYMAILWPLGVAKPDSYVLWEKSKKPTTYRQNIGLDVNKDGSITRAECLIKINERYEIGKKKMRK